MAIGLTDRTISIAKEKSQHGAKPGDLSTYTNFCSSLDGGVCRTSSFDGGVICTSSFDGGVICTSSFDGGVSKTKAPSSCSDGGVRNCTSMHDG